MLGKVLLEIQKNKEIKFVLPGGVKLMILGSRHQFWMNTNVFKHRLKVGHKFNIHHHFATNSNEEQQITASEVMRLP